MKDRQFSFALSSEEHRALHEVAQAAGQSAADWLRTIIAQAHKAAGLRLAAPPDRFRFTVGARGESKKRGQGR